MATWVTSHISSLILTIANKVRMMRQIRHAQGVIFLRSRNQYHLVVMPKSYIELWLILTCIFLNVSSVCLTSGGKYRSEHCHVEAMRQTVSVALLQFTWIVCSPATQTNLISACPTKSVLFVQYFTHLCPEWLSITRLWHQGVPFPSKPVIFFIMSDMRRVRRIIKETRLRLMTMKIKQC
jgi:hypothetical protein